MYIYLYFVDWSIGKLITDKNWGGFVNPGAGRRSI